MDITGSQHTTDNRRAHLASALAGRYTLGDELGRGGMATVYRARDERHGRDVALKVIRPDAASALGTDRFLAEIRVTANLVHPNILPLLDSGESDGVLFYVMPYIEGETLRTRMRRVGSMPLEEVSRVLRAVTEALAYAHTKGVVHRDIKPENILLAGRQTWVADFGIAKAMASAATSPHAATSVGMAIGSPGYMAPEQIEGSAQIDHHADIYSVGVTAWEMLAGRAVFDGSTMQQLFLQHLTAAPTPIDNLRPDVSATLAHAVMTCLAKSPADRWETADALLERLEAAIITGSTPPVRTRLRSRIPIGVGGLLVAGAMAVTLWKTSTNTPVFQRSTPRRLTSLLNAHQACLSPDGQWIAFRRQDVGQVWVQRVDSGVPRQLAPAAPGTLAWLNDSTVAVIAVDESLRTIRLSSGLPSSPEWSRDRPGEWHVAGPGNLYHVSIVEKDSSRLLVRGATDVGWRDSVNTVRQPGERILWIAGELGSAMKALGSETSDGSRHISIIRPTGLREDVVSVPVGDTARGYVNLRFPAFMERDSRYLYFDPRGRSTTFRLDLEHPARPLTTVPLELTGLNDVTRDGRMVFELFEIIVHMRRFTIPLGDATAATTIHQSRAVAPQHLALSPDGTLLARAVYSPENERATLTLLGVGGGSSRELLSTPILTVPKWSPDGTRIAVAVREADVATWMVVDVRDGTQVRFGKRSLRPTGFPAFVPAWSADGKSLYVTDVDRQAVRRFSVTTGDTGTIVGNMDWAEPGRHTQRAAEGVILSPDGRVLAVGGRSLVTLPTNGGRAREIVRVASSSLVIPLVWREDGQIVYLTPDGGGKSLFLRQMWEVSASGGTPRLVGTLPEECEVNVSLLQGNREAACTSWQRVSEIWMVDRRE